MKNHPSSWQGLVDPEDMKRLYEKIQVIFKEDATLYEHLKYKHKNGNTVHVICRGSVLERNEAGEPLIIAGTHTDITELVEAKNNLQDMCDNKSAFIALLNHELRSPLNAVIGFSELIKHADDFDQVDEYVDWILKASKNMLEMVNEVIDMTQIELTGYSKTEICPTDILEIICEEIGLQHGIDDNIEVHLDTELHELVMDTDPKKFQKIISNLLSNAIKYSKQEGIVTVFADKTKIQIIDNGIGISEDNLKSLFTPFQTFSTPRRDSLKSSGLGLSLVKKLCEVLNIGIQVESKLNKGTTFTLIL
jgi:signal transduction histidine kinase